MAALLLVCWTQYLQATGNFHVVEAGEVYRSNTLGATQLEAVIAENHIRTVLNLRGLEADADWYRTEASVIAAHGATMISLPLLAEEEPSDALLGRLVMVLQTAPKPLLIHCRAGADRTGLASALYELIVAEKSPAEAAGQLSLWFGHFPWLGSRTEAMDRTFWRVAGDPTYQTAGESPQGATL